MGTVMQINCFANSLVKTMELRFVECSGRRLRLYRKPLLFLFSSRFVFLEITKSVAVI
jgi:hypothetical protein